MKAFARIATACALAASTLASAADFPPRPITPPTENAQYAPYAPSMTTSPWATLSMRSVP